jgi:hypothetical protein
MGAEIQTLLATIVKRMIRVLKKRGYYSAHCSLRFRFLASDKSQITKTYAFKFLGQKLTRGGSTAGGGFVQTPLSESAIRIRYPNEVNAAYALSFDFSSARVFQPRMHCPSQKHH